MSWVRLAADLRRSSLAVLSAREEERRRIRRDLHDGLGPQLTGISLGLRTAIRQLERGPAPDGTPLRLLGRLADEMDTTVEEVKRIVRDLRPTALDQLGLVGAVAEFAHGFDDALQLHLELPAPRPRAPGGRRGRGLPHRHRGAHQRRPPRRGGPVLAAHRRPATSWRSRSSTTASACRPARPSASAWPRCASAPPSWAARSRSVPARPHGTRLHVLLPAALPMSEPSPSGQERR